jgi:hypothetical protein
MFGCISVVVVEVACVMDCSELGLCTAGTVGKSVGGEYAAGRGSVVTAWGRIRGRGEDKGREWMRRDKKSSWEEQWIVAQEKEGK